MTAAAEDDDDDEEEEVPNDIALTAANNLSIFPSMLAIASLDSFEP